MVVLTTTAVPVPRPNPALTKLHCRRPRCVARARCADLRRTSEGGFPQFGGFLQVREATSRSGPLIIGETDRLVGPGRFKDKLLQVMAVVDQI